MSYEVPCNQYPISTCAKKKKKKMSRAWGGTRLRNAGEISSPQPKTMSKSMHMQIGANPWQRDDRGHPFGTEHRFLADPRDLHQVRAAHRAGRQDDLKT